MLNYAIRMFNAEVALKHGDADFNTIPFPLDDFSEDFYQFFTEFWNTGFSISGRVFPSISKFGSMAVNF